MSLNDTTDNMHTPVLGVLEWFRPGEETRVKQVLADLQKLGIKELRTGFSWADYYTPAGEAWYKWLIPTLAKEVRVLPCFLYTPPSLGLAPRTSSPPVNPKAYADFLDVMITEYGEHFDWVELWNEPNNKVEYDYTLDHSWELFGEMIGGAANWARVRGKKTVLGGMSPVDPNWLQTMFDRGVMQYIDAVGMHGFPDVFDQQWEGWEANVNKVKQVLQSNNCNVEIWITEAGYSTWKHDEFRQLQEFKEVLKADVARVYWYGCYDLDPELPTVGGFNVDEREYHFGLRKADGTPKLLYRMLAEYGPAGLDMLSFVDSQPDLASHAPYSLISGGAGFIGTNVAKRLLSEGKRVLILDNLSRPGVERNLAWLHQNYGNKLQVLVADIRNLHMMKIAVSGAEQVFHFAAQVAVTTSLDLPINDFEINARGTVNLLEAIRLSKRKPSLVFTSTNKVYGGLEDLEFISNGSRYKPADKAIEANGISEQRPLDFHSPYGCSKGSADQYVIDYARSFNLNAVVFRMSCIYGPHQYGTEDQGWVAHFAIRAIEEQPISIYGDGKQVRDILFVEDLVDAMLLAQKNMPSISGQAFNIGGGPKNTTSLLELLKILGKFNDKELPIKFGAWRTGDQHYYVSDIRKFAEATGWYPKHNVQQGMAKLYNWLCDARGIERTVPVPSEEKSTATVETKAEVLA